MGEEGGRLTVSVPNGSAFATDQLKKVENRELVLETARRLQTGLREIVFTPSGVAGGVAAGAAGVGSGGALGVVRFALAVLRGVQLLIEGRE